ncbi:MAG: hypothetical protein ACFE9I_10280 [Candidatus Hermodarchaeota archaeon]
MRDDIEKRLHRVMIKLKKKDIVCPYAKECISSESSNRCNQFYNKCSRFTDFVSNSI